MKPTIATAMLRLAGAHLGTGRLIDPMCGAAVIPVEAARLNSDLEIWAADWDPSTVELAQGTLSNHELSIRAAEADARTLGERHPSTFDHIVTDPPYGIRQGKHTSIASLYRSLLASFEHALKPTGTLTLIIVKHRLFESVLADTRLRITHHRTLQSSTLTPHLYILNL